MNDLKFYKKYNDVESPFHATSNAACFDIHAYIKEDIPITVYGMDNVKEKKIPTGGILVLRPGDRVLVPTGLIFDIPVHHSVRIHARSSISLKFGLTIPNGEGIIDSDYYHETFVMLYNASADEVTIEDGTRIAQGEMVRNDAYDVLETNQVPAKKTNRVGGFGSTGVK
tara:strand:- start:1619 stop:2125 length:507 start_codon:yes stop_codon:yes gene_type:complete